MARSRNIKPGFFLNDKLAEVEPLGRLLFAGLWCLADREGRLKDRPNRIKAEVLPYDNCDVDKLLDDLAQRGFIIRYEVQGNRYLQVTNFAKHQNPHVKEKPSEIPAPDLCDTSVVQVSEKHDTDSVPVKKRTDRSGKQKCRNEDLAGEIQVQDKHRTSTVQAQEEHRTDPADILIPDSLNLIPDSLHPHPEHGPSMTQARAMHEDDDDDDEESFLKDLGRAFESAFGYPPNSTQTEMLLSFVKDGMREEVVLEALKRSAENGAQNPSYTKSILQSWLSKKAYTLDDVKTLDKFRSPPRSRGGPVTRDEFTYKQTRQDRSQFAFLRG